jgi:hypothetical protein
LTRVYQGGKEAVGCGAARVRLPQSGRFSGDERQEVLPIEMFTKERSADVNVALPLDRLATGAYLLTLESTVARRPRNVRFALTWSSRRAAIALLLATLTVAAVAAQRGQVLNPLPAQRGRGALAAAGDAAAVPIAGGSGPPGRVRPRSRPPPVTGLGPSDFTILENGQPQTLAVFNAVNIPVAVPPKTAWLRDVAPDVRSNEDQRERRIFLILIDDAAIQAVPLALQNVKKVAGTSSIASVPSDLAAVVFTATIATRRTSRWIARGCWPPLTSSPWASGTWATPACTFRIPLTWSADVETLAELPDREGDRVRRSGCAGGSRDGGGPASLGITDGAFSAASQRGEMGQLRHLMEQAFLAAARANVSVYTIDVCGLRVEGQRAGFGPVCVPVSRWTT